MAVEREGSLHEATEAERFAKSAKWCGLALSPVAAFVAYRLILAVELDPAFLHPAGMAAIMTIGPAIARMFGIPPYLFLLIPLSSLAKPNKATGTILTVKGIVYLLGITFGSYLLICELGGRLIAGLFRPERTAPPPEVDAAATVGNQSAPPSVKTARGSEADTLEDRLERVSAGTGIEASKLAGSEIATFVFSRVAPREGERLVCYSDVDVRTSYVLTNERFHFKNGDIGGEKGTIEVADIEDVTWKEGYLFTKMFLTLTPGKRREIGKLMDTTGPAYLAEWVRASGRPEGEEDPVDRFLRNTHACWGRGEVAKVIPSTLTNAKGIGYDAFKRGHMKDVAKYRRANATRSLDPDEFLVAAHATSYILTNRAFYITHKAPDAGPIPVYLLSDVESCRVKFGWSAKVRLVLKSGAVAEHKGLESGPGDEVVEFALRRARE